MSFLSPTDFCERIKTIYWDSRKRFKMCLSSGFLLLCLSLLFPLPFTAFVASLTRGYSCTCQPWFSKEYPLSLSLITCFPTVAHSDQPLFQSILPSQPNKNISSLKVYPTRASLASSLKASWHSAELPQMFLSLPYRATWMHVQAQNRVAAATPDALGICGWFLIICLTYGSPTLAKSGLHACQIEAEETGSPGFGMCAPLLSCYKSCKVSGFAE